MGGQEWDYVRAYRELRLQLFLKLGGWGVITSFFPSFLLSIPPSLPPLLQQQSASQTPSFSVLSLSTASLKACWLREGSCGSPLATVGRAGAPGSRSHRGPVHSGQEHTGPGGSRLPSGLNLPGQDELGSHSAPSLR